MTIHIIPSGDDCFICGGELEIHTDGIATDLPSWARQDQHIAFGKLRKASGLTLRQTSDLLQMKPSEVSGLEHGHFDLPADEWAVVARRFQIAGRAIRP